MAVHVAAPSKPLPATAQLGEAVLLNDQPSRLRVVMIDHHIVGNELRGPREKATKPADRTASFIAVLCVAAAVMVDHDEIIPNRQPAKIAAVRKIQGRPGSKLLGGSGSDRPPGTSKAPSKAAMNLSARHAE